MKSNGFTLEAKRRRYRQILEWRKEGKTFEEIGNYLGVTRQAIQLRVKQGEPKEPKVPPRTEFVEIGVRPRGREWTRMLVRYRDNFTCRDCGLVRTLEEVRDFNGNVRRLKGKMKSLDVHHLEGLCGKKSRGYDSVKDINLLITLCHKCHFNRHDYSKRHDGSWKTT